jgi:hypothetical protein
MLFRIECRDRWDSVLLLEDTTSAFACPVIDAHMVMAGANGLSLRLISHRF